MMTKWTAYSMAWSAAFNQARQAKIISYRALHKKS